MAARRITQSSINWSALAERVPPTQKTNFLAFKTRSDKYIRSVLANPATPPALDWAHYSARISMPGLVDNFRKQYEAVQVPYPADKYSNQVDAQEKDIKQEIDAFVKSSLTRIAEHEKAIQHLQSLLPYEQMTMEDYRDAFPDAALDAINRPTFWPHLPEDQIGYKSESSGGAAPPSH